MKLFRTVTYRGLLVTKTGNRAIHWGAMVSGFF